MRNQTFSRFGGLFIFLVSAAVCAFIWHSMLTRGIYWPKAGFFFPVFGFLGLSMMLYPVRHDVVLGRSSSEQVKWKNLPVGQKAVILFGVVIGVAQLTVFEGLWTF
jgi:hypothetical protein